jgi:hypothetical protein
MATGCGGGGERAVSSTAPRVESRVASTGNPYRLGCVLSPNEVFAAVLRGQSGTQMLRESPLCRASARLVDETDRAVSRQPHALSLLVKTGSGGAPAVVDRSNAVRSIVLGWVAGATVRALSVRRPELGRELSRARGPRSQDPQLEELVRRAVENGSGECAPPSLDEIATEGRIVAGPLFASGSVSKAAHTVVAGVADERFCDDLKEVVKAVVAKAVAISRRGNAVVRSLVARAARRSASNLPGGNTTSYRRLEARSILEYALAPVNQAILLRTMPYEPGSSARLSAAQLGAERGVRRDFAAQQQLIEDLSQRADER